MFFDFSHDPVFQKLEKATFRKVDLFRYSAEGGEQNPVYTLPSLPSPEDGNRPSFRNIAFTSF
jgi:hypothetical protein